MTRAGTAARVTGIASRFPSGLWWVLAVGLIARAVLIPITHGQDFVVWDRASLATLHGVNIYAHHPHYPGGPYAYFPLFLYVELPFRWLALHAHLSFTVLGKLPILTGDVLATLLLAERLRPAGRGWVVAGSAAFFLNPLVLYNSAFYGRFDSLGCALLLLALRRVGSDVRTGVGAGVDIRGAVAFAFAVAAKTFPGFVILVLIRRGRSSAGRVVAALVLVLGVLSIPYLGALRPYVHDIVLYDARKVPQALSWQQIFLHVMGASAARDLSYLLLALFVIGAIVLAGLADVTAAVLLTLLLFILCSKVVLEQYLIWPMPWLILVLARIGRLRVPTALLLGWFTLVGMLVNPYIHPFGQSPLLVSCLLGLSIAAYLVLAYRFFRREDRATVTADASPE